MAILLPSLTAFFKNFPNFMRPPAFHCERAASIGSDLCAESVSDPVCDAVCDAV